MFKTVIIQEVASEVASRLPENCPICQSSRCCYKNHDGFDCNTFCYCRCFTFYINPNHYLNNTDYTAHITINEKIYFCFNISALNNKNCVNVSVILNNEIDLNYNYKYQPPAVIDNTVFKSYSELLDYINNISSLYLKYSKLALLL